MLWIIFDIDLAVTCKIKVSLKLNKPAYVGMCIFEWSINVVAPFWLH